MESSLARALEQAVALLAELPRGREDVADAQARAARFGIAHPEFEPELLVDRPPGSPRVDYDLFLRHPAGGTVALAWRGDDGLPWPGRYATHWAANYVVSVDDRDVTIQDALLFLKLASERYPDLMNELVDRQIIGRAIEREPVEVSETEIQVFADQFRRARGLDRVDTMQRWLSETGLSPDQFRDLVAQTIEDRKVKDRVSAAAVEDHFAANRARYDSVRWIRVEARAVETLLRVRDRAAEIGLAAAAAADESIDLRATMATRPARDLPEELVAARVAEIVGPTTAEGSPWLGQVLARRPAALDGPTRARIRDVVFQEWLREQRERAAIRWHWI
jgi:putative peptide maturation system protein